MKKFFKIFFIILFVSIIGVYSFITWQCNSIISDMANMRVEKNSSFINKYKEEITRIETKTDDGLKISAWNFSTHKPKAIVIIIHGMHGMDSSSLLNFGKFFQEHNYESFCLDLRAHGYSEGNRIGFGYKEVNDVNALIDWIQKKDKYKNKNVILYGISMGGATAINTAANREDIDQVISVSSFESYESAFIYYMEKEDIPPFIINLFKPGIRMILLTK